MKPTKSAVSYMTTATYELPYEGAKEMLLVEDVDSKEYLAGLFNAMYDELPVHKSNNKKSVSGLIKNAGHAGIACFIFALKGN